MNLTAPLIVTLVPALGAVVYLVRRCVHLEEDKDRLTLDLIRATNDKAALDAACARRDDHITRQAATISKQDVEIRRLTDHTAELEEVIENFRAAEQ